MEMWVDDFPSAMVCNDIAYAIPDDRSRISDRYVIGYHRTKPTLSRRSTENWNR